MEDRWFVYIVRCSDDTLYTGITNDVSKRIEKHNSGKGARYTRSRVPIRLEYAEICGNRSEASRREYQIKRLERSEKEEIIRQYNACNPTR